MAEGWLNWGLSTRCVHAGTVEDTVAGGVNTPIFASSAFRVPGPTGRVVYPRYQNIPGQVAVAQKIAALENAQAGIVVASGMAAISSVFLAFCQTGDHVILHRDLYGGTLGLARKELPRRGIDITWVDAFHVEDFEAAFRPQTRLIYVETPSNPLMNILDLETLAQMARSRGVLTVVDNTFATPINQNPLDLGIDIVVHSGTKYLNGHSDLCCGAVVGAASLLEAVTPVISLYGPSLSPYDCFLLERGLKTLALRMARHNHNAMAVAAYLAQDPRVARVYYPGLSEHPHHHIAARQMRGFGGMLSFEPKGNTKTAHRVMERFHFFQPAVSLGGVESLACFPVETSHASVPPLQREQMGIRDTLIRLSVGIEDTEDLLKDVDQALEAVL
ncbi:trans-sulfuration enzyme family protein [Desulfosoma sp.]|uniref:trans-sulfuration enzyme family protein n=1 Tax=Desulfosoma sp. TaxID=2603217 RepID=UPI00404BA44D